MRQQSFPCCISTVKVMNPSEVLIFPWLTQLHLYCVSHEICLLLSGPSRFCLVWVAAAFHMCEAGGVE